MTDRLRADAPMPGHNSGAMAESPAAGKTLRAYFERIQRLQEEINELNQDKAAVYQEVKAQGFDLAVFRVVVSRAQQQRADLRQRDEMIALYERMIFGDADAEATGNAD